MARTWVLMGRVLRVPLLAPGDAPPAGGEGEAEAEAHGVAEAEAADAQAEAHGAAEVEAADAQAEAQGVAELEAADAKAEAQGVAELKAADAQAAGGGHDDEAAAQHGAADFSIPLAEPPRITVMTAAPTAHPYREYPDRHPYILCVDSDCILLNFGVEPFEGTCFDDRPYQSNLIVVRDYNWAGVEQGHPITAIAERVPPRDGPQAIVTNIESIGLIYGLDAEDYVIAELMISKGRDRALLVYFYAGLHSKWIEEFTDNPLPWLQERHREWIPSGVVSYNKMLWWFDLSWGIISYDPLLETTEPLLLFHRLPEGQDLNKAQRVHDRRCIAVSQGGLRYVAITPDADAATVSMWTRIPSVLGHDGTFGWMWEAEFTVSFAEIWEHDSYTATGLPRKVPVLAAVCPSNANIVYFALEDPKRLFGVNMYSRRVEEFIDESYELVTPGPEAPPSCRYVLPWFPPLEVAQALGEDPLAGDAEDEELSDEEELQEAESDDKEVTESEDEEEEPVTESEDEEEEPVAESEDTVEQPVAESEDTVEQPVAECEDEEEQLEPEVDYDPLGETPEIKDSELPVSESSDEGPLSVAMDPATVARLRSELEEERRSRNPGPGDDAGEGAF
ncbi:hypothetical protein BDA96_01G546600 [Sorghum bicolor]|uniref:DUF1618 domain-containing protein n=1 Tax=Sorghum bicolor TaxID=4558 RepID=A0A921S7K8_SORBI|nr:hypothetical protein BDA96_01G546600 [Sorghum bicolor]